MNILNFLGFQLVLNNLYFVIRHGKARKRKDVSQILYWLGVEFTFFCFGIKTSLMEMLEHFFYMLVMFGHVIWVDEYIIQIDHNTDIQEIGENVIHESLKGYGSIGKIKRHYRLFKWFIACSKSRFITISDVNQMVSIVKIYFYINLSVKIAEDRLNFYFSFSFYFYFYFYFQSIFYF